MAEITENEVGMAVLQILSEQPDGEATVEVLKVELPKRLTLSADDPVSWDQHLRNIKSHDTIAGNIFRDFYVIVASRGGWQITPNGRRRIKAE